MQNYVCVSFNKEQRFEFKFNSTSIGATPEEARRWFDHEFQALGCDVVTPTGKILIVDRILSVAKYAGEKRFLEQPTWAEQFAKYTSAILGRDVIRVDVAAYTIGHG